MILTQKCIAASYKKIFIFLVLLFSLAANSGHGQNNALNFDGSGDDVVIPYNPALNFSITDNFTIELWFKTFNITTVLYSTHVDISPYPGYEVAVVNSKVVFDLTNNYITNSIRIETTNSYNDGLWHHVACVYKGIPTASNVDIYVDGILQSQNVTNNNLTASINTLNNTHLGSRGNTAYYLTGTMDEVRVWHRALCGTEIAARKNCGLTGSENGLVAYYNFNEGVGSSTNTSVSTLTNATSVTNLTGTLNTFALSGAVSNWVASTASVSGMCSAFGPSVSVVGNTVICPSNSTTLSISGASNYTWFPLNITSASVALSPSVTTSYTVAYPTGSCTAYTNPTVAVTVLSPTVVAAVASSVVCSGQQTTLTASGANSYSWYPGGSNGPVVAINPISSTVYTVTGATTCGVDSKTVSVLVNPSPVITATASSNSICQGSTLTLGASGATTYSWLPDNLTGSTIVSSPAFYVTYTVIGYSGGCSGTANVVVNVTGYPLLILNSNQPTVCAGSSSTLTVSGALNYVWFPSNSTGTTLIVNPGATTNYTVFGTNGVCGTYGHIGVNVIPNPVLNISTSSSVICPGGSAVLSANGATSYSWFPGNFSGQNITVSPSSTTIYTVSGSVSGPMTNCTSTTNIVLNVIPPPVINVVTPTSVVCAGGSATLQASGATSYTWFPGNLNSASITVNPPSTTVYTVAGSNGACMSATTTILNVVPWPGLSVSATPSAACIGSSVNLVATGAITYTWNNGSHDSIVSVLPNTNTIYTVSFNTAGCAGTSTILVNVNPLPQINATLHNTAICIGESNNISASGGITYLWQPGALSGSLVTVSPTINTSYTVIGTDANGCSNTTQVSQLVNACTGIKSRDLNSASILIYPNPNEGDFTLELTNFSESAELILSDNIGRVVFHQTMSNGWTSIGTQHLTKGIYQCVVLENKQILCRTKIVIR